MAKQVLRKSWFIYYGNPKSQWNNRVTPRNFPRAFPRIRTWNSRFIRLFLALLQKIPLISDWSITWRTKSVPSLHPHYKDFKATTNWSAPVLCIGTLAWQGYCFQLLPFHHNDRFSRSIRKPVSRSRHLHAGCHSISKQVSFNLSPHFPPMSVLTSI